jgi:hypothetical protein
MLASKLQTYLIDKIHLKKVITKTCSIGTYTKNDGFFKNDF